MTQNELILDMLRRGPVTPFDALQEAGCFRLAARVRDLRDMGYDIHTELRADQGKRHAVRYAIYHLNETNAA